MAGAWSYYSNWVSNECHAQLAFFLLYYPDGAPWNGALTFRVSILAAINLMEISFHRHSQSSFLWWFRQTRPEQICYIQWKAPGLVTTWLGGGGGGGGGKWKWRVTGEFTLKLLHNIQLTSFPWTPEILHFLPTFREVGTRVKLARS